ncbi:MAG: hypothetical protein ACLRPT_06970 [Akkermansia muciniphila]
MVVDKMMGTIWDGTFTGRVLAQIDDGDALNGSFVLQDMIDVYRKSYDKRWRKPLCTEPLSFHPRAAT